MTIDVAYGLVEQGKWLNAKFVCENLISQSPDNFSAYYLLGIVNAELGNAQTAIECFQNSLLLNPQSQPVLFNLALVQNSLFYYEDALKTLKTLLIQNPNDVDALILKSSILLEVELYEDALLSSNKALELNPNNFDALISKGNIFIKKKLFTDAIKIFQNLISINKNSIEAHFGFSFALIQINHRLEDAVRSLRQVTSLNPKFAEGWRQLAYVLEKMGDKLESLDAFARFLDLKPASSYAYGHLFLSRMKLNNWETYDHDCKNILSFIDQGIPVIDPQSALALPSTRYQSRRASELFCADQFKNFISTSFPIDRKGNERIRIAYFSSDFHSHPVGILTARLFELHDREKFEVYAFSSGIPSRDPVRMRIEGGVDHFINVREMSDFEMVDLARAENIDIAIDMTGYTADNRAAAFALRLAPIQVNYLGYSGTMGAAFMDYIIGDPVLIPPDHENDYSEKIARLPDCYMPSDPTREVSERSMTRSEFGLPEDGFIFCAFNNPYKITPPQFDLWMQILKSVPKSVLWLSPTSQKAMENLCHEARKRGVEPSRLVFSKRMNQLSEHLARQQLADLFLDTLPHNAHATSNDALWAGLPILTRLGEGFAGRVAGSLLTAVGMPDMIMPNSQSYVARAIEIATTPGLSAKLKARLAENKKKMPLFDAEKYTRNLEKAYLIMHDRRINGLAPVSLDIKE